MPVADRADFRIASESMFHDLATVIVRLFMSRIPHKSSCRPFLRTIALGALTHRDRYLENHSFNSSEQFLQRRNYHVDYVKNYHKKSALLLTLISKRYVHTDEVSEHAFILDPYWLA